MGGCPTSGAATVDGKRSMSILSSSAAFFFGSGTGSACAQAREQRMKPRLRMIAGAGGARRYLDKVLASSWIDLPVTSTMAMGRVF